MGAAASALPAQVQNPEDAAALAKAHGLRPIGVRPPLGEYLRAAWRRREFTHVLASSKAYSENQGLYLGQLWAVLTPTMNAIFYVAIFGLLLKVSRGVDNVAAFIVVGTFVFRLFDEGVNSAARAITSNTNLVRALQFPRIVLPTSAVLSKFLGQVASIAVMAVIVILSRFVPNSTPINPSWRWAMLPVVIVMLFAFSLGVGFMFARVCSALPDILNFMPFIFRLVMYGSGVIFPISRYIDNPKLEGLFELQPVALFLDISRQTMMNEPGIPWNWTRWALAAGWTVVVLIVGLVFFWQAEARYGRE